MQPLASLIALAVLVPAVAAADPMTGITASPASPEGIAARQEDVASNRNVLAPTAITVPRGDVEVTAQSLWVWIYGVRANVGVTSTTEVWVEGATTYFGGSAAGLGVKQQVVRTPGFRVALLGAVAAGNGSKSGSVGAVATVCAGPRCTLAFSTSIEQLFGDGYSDTAWSTGVSKVSTALSVGSPTVRFVGEAHYADGDLVGVAGVRFGTRRFALDLAALFALRNDDEMAVFDDVTESILPWLAVTARM